ncbi:MAG: hypothetical protein KJ718_03550 [Nanoarchaeota archaeon]|nr:hypothetical protein [Nanoarchaeota archaeon]MBU1051605.1 hypothetical protein [Nanoarchaeota archaeon]MBU1988041.1 hypothetical protein [Nanoarchaeota archaeon]
MDKIKASLILEILGRPVEYVKESLNTVVVKMGSEKGVKILKQQYHEPTLVKDTKDLFTAFAEVDVEFDSISNYLGIVFAYFPSHIEITLPEKITLSNIDLNELGNSLVQRLHNYDAIVKKVMAEREIIAKKLKQVAPELFKQNDVEEKEVMKWSKKKESKKKAKKKSEFKKKSTKKKQL